MPKPPNLKAAYGLSSPEDNVRLYADWAATYDESFATSHDYQLHEHVARTFAERGGRGPVLDIGAGTGLCGVALQARGIDAIDATDISAEMLEVARQKGIYRDLFAGDILEGLDRPDASYSGVVSSGTFTTGHVGPEALDEVLRLVCADGLVVVSINAKHWESAGFAAKFAELEPHIRDLELPKCAIYGGNATGPNAKDEAFVATFRKA